MEVGVNNSYCERFEETVNDVRVEKEQAGLLTVSNSLTEQPYIKGLPLCRTVLPVI